MKKDEDNVRMGKDKDKGEVESDEWEEENVEAREGDATITRRSISNSCGFL